MKRGILVAIEGIDGAGKSTQRGRLEQRLADAGIPYVATKEPTDGPWGRKIRQSAISGRMAAKDELAAFVADRRQHVDELIEPSLAAGNVVLIDRYYPSSVAYQGARPELTAEQCLQANSFAPVPDVLIILDIDPAAGLERVNNRGQADEFEKLDYLVKVREIFLSLPIAKHVIDATGSEDALSETIGDLVMAAWEARP